MMRTLLLATVIMGATAQSSSCGSLDECPMDYGTSLLQVSANPETGALLGIENQAHPGPAPAEEAAAHAPAPAGDAAPAPAEEAAGANSAEPAGDLTLPTAADNAAATGVANATNGTNATNATGANASSEAEASTTPPPPTGCAVREDSRAKAWFAETSPVGVPCVFGVDGDVRDEGSHCIYDNGDFGSNGWCYTAKDRSAWGSCNGLCPLYGPSKQLGAKIDHVDKMVDKVLKAVDDTSSADNSTEEATNNDAEKETPKGKGKGKGKDTGKGPKPAKKKSATDNANNEASSDKKEKHAH